MSYDETTGVCPCGGRPKEQTGKPRLKNKDTFVDVSGTFWMFCCDPDAMQQAYWFSFHERRQIGTRRIEVVRRVENSDRRS